MNRAALVRTLAAMVVGSAVALAPAAATAAPRHGEWVAGGPSDAGYSVQMQGLGGAQSTSLITLELDSGAMLKTYSTQAQLPVDHDGKTEHPQTDFPDPTLPFTTHRRQITWILEHGYPETALDQLAAATGALFHDGLDSFEAITASQAAIWHVSDGLDLVSVAGGGVDDEADVRALYDYLIGPANVGADEPSGPSVTLSPPSSGGTAGTRIGPFTITASGTITDVTGALPAGIRITDAAGHDAVAGALHDGSTLYVDVPHGATAGSGTVTVQATASAGLGGLFIADNYDQSPSRTLIVAQSATMSANATATIEWTAAPTPTPTTPTTSSAAGSSGDDAVLPDTGAPGLLLGLAGIVLVLAGSGVVMLRRRDHA